MDKYEYKIRSEEIKTLIGRKKYTEAMEIADTIDWRRVKSVNMLCTVSDLYKLNRKYEESREILLLAYERCPGGRMIVYSLCELSIKLDDVVHAVEYYKEFVQTAPRDNGRYVLQYKLYEAQEVTLEERIAVLEELKRREYREKWAYELAYLYHRIGLSTKCVEECDELILWFGEGKYVLKAMELKMLHTPLSAEQQKKYKKLKGTSAPVIKMPKKDQAETEDDDELNIEVQPVNVGEYATINLQKELAESMKEVLGEEDTYSSAQPTIEYTAIGADTGTDEIRDFGTGMETDELEAYEENEELEYSEMREPEPEYVEEEPVFAEEQPVFAEEEPVFTEEEPVFTREKPVFTRERPVIGKEQPETAEPAGQRLIKEEQKEIYLDGPGDFTREILTNLLQNPEDAEEVQEQEEETPDAEEVFFEDGDTMELPEVSEPSEPAALSEPAAPSESTAPSEPTAERMAQEENSEFDNLLSQEYDGQIRFVMPAEDKIEKQITGQISIDDILLEWERVKKENEEQRAEAVRQRVMEQTGEIFSQFDVSTKQGLLAELDDAADDSDKEKRDKKRLTEKEEKKLAEIAEIEEDLPEVEELEEIEEKTPTENFAYETIEAARRAAENTKETDKSENTLEIADESAAAEAPAEEEKAEEPKEEEVPAKEKENEKPLQEERQERPPRSMTAEEKKLFGPFIQTKSTRNQILDTLDHISLASYTGNVILTGEPGMGSIKLAKNIIKEIQMTDNNFSGRMAKITGQALNHKDMEKTFEKLSNGALIIEGAGELKEATVTSMTRLLEQEKQGIIIILEDTKINMNKLLDNHKALHRNFNLRIDVEALDNDSLVLYGKRYALEKEYAIDELGVLALYTRIAEMQTSEHSVTTKEVREIVDEAIYHAGRKNMGHFMDVLFGKRYDEEDMIILREKDFA